ncbi:SCO family protein [Microvirga sp. 2MCAF38]|uniref:SCO family protein n=1 Tax=Microvirga sp. 2MCAF38 TaxID=3232989 RepID=UPI003F9AB099
MRVLMNYLAAFLMLSGSAWAGLSERDLAAVKLAPLTDARLPPGLTFLDFHNRRMSILTAIEDRPALLVPVDYTCRSTCGPTLAIVSAALGETGLAPGRDYHVIVVGIDARDGIEDARALRDTQIVDPAVGASTTFLRGDAETVQSLLQALDYQVVYDSENDQFAHPNGVLALTSDGRISRVLSGIGLDSQNLRLALLEAGEGKIGGLRDRFILMCYGFDPVHGIYTPLIKRVLTATGTLTVGILGVVLVLLWRRDGRARREAS